jgi:hypothetical protein
MADATSAMGDVAAGMEELHQDVAALLRSQVTTKDSPPHKRPRGNRYNVHDSRLVCK